VEEAARHVDRIDWSHLDAQLAAHACADEKEARDVTLVRDFLRDHPRDAHLRSQSLGHLTGSGFVLDATRTQVLLLHHGRLNRWLQPGGHGEGETDPREIALREIAEETGLTDLRPLQSPRPEARGPRPLFDVDVHPIPARPGEPAHLHLDLRYAFVAKPDALPRLSSESRALAWFPLDALPAGADASLRRAARKLLGAAPLAE
jgi:8-oxo-dGTP pyrophosphatase MutT (NUDIX family)